MKIILTVRALRIVLQLLLRIQLLLLLLFSKCSIFQHCTRCLVLFRWSLLGLFYKFSTSLCGLLLRNVLGDAGSALCGLAEFGMFQEAAASVQVASVAN